MHPAIAAFPAARFYGGRLRDAPSVRDAATHAPWVRQHGASHLGPWALLDVASGNEERDLSGSLYNAAEARAVVALLRTLRDEWRVAVHELAVVRVLTFYAAQVPTRARARTLTMTLQCSPSAPRRYAASARRSRRRACAASRSRPSTARRAPRPTWCCSPLCAPTRAAPSASPLVERALHPVVDTAPSASLEHLKARGSPTHPGAPMEPRGSLAWPQEPASGRPKEEDFSLPAAPR